MIAAFTTAAAVFALYFNTLHNGFIWDDFSQVQSNIWIRNVKFIPEILARNVWGFKNEGSNYYRPGMHLGYMMVYYIFGPGPWGFHLLNVVFNTGASVMVFLIALEIFESAGVSSGTVLWTAFLSALLFTAHPIHTEAVAYIAAFTELSYSLFYLMSLYFFILWRKGRLREGIHLSCLFFVLSFLCKETALTLPLAIAAYEISFPNGNCAQEAQQKKRLRIFIPYVALTAIYFAVRLKVVGLTRIPKASFHLTGFQFLLNTITNFGLYLKQLLYPVNLNVYHVFHPVHSIWEWRSIFSIAALLIFAGTVFLTYNKDRPVFFGFVMIIVPLLPALYLPAFSPDNTYAERYLYLPSIGFVLIAARLFYSGMAAKTRFAALALAVLLITVYSVKTVNRNSIWNNESSLWTDALRKSPDGWMPPERLGTLLLNEGKYTEAIGYFKTAIKLAPNMPDPFINLGYALLNQGRADEAANQFKAVIRSMPFYGEAHRGLGVAYSLKGRADKAETELRVAIGLNPNSWPAHLDLGRLYYERKMFGPALKEFSEASYINPYSGELHRYMSLAYANQGLFDKAIEQSKAAIKLAPSAPENYNDLGNLYLKKGRLAKAAESYQAALKIDPGNREAQKNLKALQVK